MKIESNIIKTHYEIESLLLLQRKISNNGWNDQDGDSILLSEIIIDTLIRKNESIIKTLSNNS